MMNTTQFADIPASEFVFENQGKELKDAAFESEQRGYFTDACHRLARNKASLLAFAIICFIVLGAIFFPEMSQYGFNDQNTKRLNMPPRVPVLCEFGILDGTSVLTNRRADMLNDTEIYPEGCVLETFNEHKVMGVSMVDVKVDFYKYINADDEYHFMGTDYLGRDQWTRLWRGARISLIIAFVSVMTNIFIGLVYGAIAGYFGGKADMIMMRICEIVDAFPQIVVITLFILFFGTGIFSIIMALTIRGWIPTARMIRSQFLRFKGREYVLAARTMGVPDMKIIFRHIMPNSIGPIITRAMIAVPAAIFSESFLAFIGLGLKAPEPSIGVLLSEGQKTLLLYPYQTIFPALLISILMIAFNLFSNGLRDAFDPTTRGQ